jgi:hypothetical protein
MNEKAKKVETKARNAVPLRRNVESRLKEIVLKLNYVATV